MKSSNISARPSLPRVPVQLAVQATRPRRGAATGTATDCGTFAVCGQVCGRVQVDTTMAGPIQATRLVSISTAGTVSRLRLELVRDVCDPLSMLRQPRSHTSVAPSDADIARMNSDGPRASSQTRRHLLRLRRHTPIFVQCQRNALIQTSERITPNHLAANAIATSPAPSSPGSEATATDIAIATASPTAPSPVSPLPRPMAWMPSLSRRSPSRITSVFRRLLPSASATTFDRATLRVVDVDSFDVPVRVETDSEPPSRTLQTLTRFAAANESVISVAPIRAPASLASRSSSFPSGSGDLEAVMMSPFGCVGDESSEAARAGSVRSAPSSSALERFEALRSSTTANIPKRRGLAKSATGAEAKECWFSLNKLRSDAGIARGNINRTASRAASSTNATPLDFVQHDARPLISNVFLLNLESHDWFRYTRLLTVVVSTVLFLFAPASYVKQAWLVPLMAIALLAQLSFITRLDAYQFARVLRMFEFYFVALNLGIFISLSTVRYAQRFEDLVASGAQTNQIVFMIWRSLGTWTCSFGAMLVVSQDALLLPRTDKIFTSIVLCTFGLLFWVLSRIFVAAGAIIEPEVCTSSGVCFTLQRLRLDTSAAALLMASNCARLFIQHPDRMCFVKSTVLLQRVVSLVPRARKRVSASVQFLHASSVVAPSELSPRPQVADVATPTPCEVGLSDTTDVSVRSRSLLASALQLGGGAFQSAPLVHTSLLQSRSLSVAVYWLLTCTLFLLFIFGEPRSWSAFALVNILMVCLWARVQLHWYDRSVLACLFRNSEWWYFVALCVFYYGCNVYQSMITAFVVTSRARSGLSAPDGSITDIDMALHVASFLSWGAVLIATNMFSLSMDAVVPPYTNYKRHVGIVNLLVNMTALHHLCFINTAAADTMPQWCFTATSGACDTPLSLQMQALYILMITSLRHCFYLARSPSALLVLRAPIHVSFFRSTFAGAPDAAAIENKVAPV